MPSLKSIIWGIGLAVMFGTVALYVMKKLGDAAGSGSQAENWSNLTASEFTSNVSLIGLALVLGIIGAVLGYLKFFKS